MSSTITVNVKLFAVFRTGRFSSSAIVCPTDTSVASLADELSIPLDEIGIIMVGEKQVKPGHQLRNGDDCAIYPLIGGG